MKWEVLARWGQWVVLVLSISLASASVIWGDELVLVDNFDDSARLRPDKWFGSETRRLNSTLEASRFIAGGKLRLIAVGYGSTGSNTGRQTGHFGLGVKTPRSITALQAELTVTSTMAQVCPENPLSSQGRAQLVGFFFNDGSRSARDNLSGDVVAVLEKVVDSHDGNFIRALALRCTSRSCSQAQTIKALLFKYKWTLSQPDVLRIEWAPLDAQFVFTVNPATKAAETRRIAYDKAMGPSQPAPEQRHRIRVRHHAANCESGRRGALMNAAVDDVYVRFLNPNAIAPSRPKR